ncbi:hypothetical protein [Streptomyces venezuelae]|uniref:hypothetical protein n=1 Tax=Streptomyces venezuelae TaxID=54571 RepID=UPI00365236E7
MKRLSRRHTRIIFLALLVGIGVIAVFLIRGAGGDSPRNLKASETCLEDIFSGDPDPLERLISPDSSFTADWSREVIERSLQLTCKNSTDSATVVMTAETRDGTRQDWFSSLKNHKQVGKKSEASRFDVGTEALAWDNAAAIYSECKPYSEGSSHTQGMKRPYLSIVATATGTASSNNDEHRTDLANVAVKMLYEAQMQTGCQESFVPPSGPPRIES